MLSRIIFIFYFEYFNNLLQLTSILHSIGDNSSLKENWDDFLKLRSLVEIE